MYDFICVFDIWLECTAGQLYCMYCTGVLFLKYGTSPISNVTSVTEILTLFGQWSLDKRLVSVAIATTTQLWGIMAYMAESDKSTICW